MNTAASEAAAHRFKHFIYKFICFRSADIKCIGRIRHFCRISPSDCCCKMTERLYTRNNFDSEHICIIVYFTKLSLSISSAHIPKPWVFGNFVCIFGIEHKSVKTHQRHFSQNRFYCVHRGNCIARAVKHHTVALKGGLAAQQETGESGGFQIRQRPKELNRLPVFHL